MTPRAQARALLLLRRWRDLCLAAGRGEVTVELAQTTELFEAIDAFITDVDEDAELATSRAEGSA